MAVRICALAASLLVAASFVLFAIDRLQEDSRNQVLALKGNKARAAGGKLIDHPAPEPRVERLREWVHSDPREAIDDANDILLSPFKGIVDPKNDVWVARIPPAAIALLLYGLGGLLLANALPKPHREVHDWREATS